jgi:hypothetical protein
MWSFPQVKALAVRELEKLPMEDAHRISVYDTYGVNRALLLRCYVSLCQRREPLSLSEGHMLGVKSVILVSQTRELLRAPLSDDGKYRTVAVELPASDMERIVTENLLETTRALNGEGIEVDGWDEDERSEGNGGETTPPDAEEPSPEPLDDHGVETAFLDEDGVGGYEEEETSHPAAIDGFESFGNAVQAVQDDFHVHADDVHTPEATVIGTTEDHQQGHEEKETSHPAAIDGFESFGNAVQDDFHVHADDVHTPEATVVGITEDHQQDHEFVDSTGPSDDHHDSEAGEASESEETHVDLDVSPLDLNAQVPSIDTALTSTFGTKHPKTDLTIFTHFIETPDPSPTKDRSLVDPEMGQNTPLDVRLRAFRTSVLPTAISEFADEFPSRLGLGGSYSTDIADPAKVFELGETDVGLEGQSATNGSETLEVGATSGQLDERTLSTRTVGEGVDPSPENPSPEVDTTGQPSSIPHIQDPDFSFYHESSQPFGAEEQLEALYDDIPPAAEAVEAFIPVTESAADIVSSSTPNTGIFATDELHDHDHGEAEAVMAMEAMEAETIHVQPENTDLEPPIRDDMDDRYTPVLGNAANFASDPVEEFMLESQEGEFEQGGDAVEDLPTPTVGLAEEVATNEGLDDEGYSEDPNIADLALNRDAAEEKVGGISKEAGPKRNTNPFAALAGVGADSEDDSEDMFWDSES